MAIRLKSRMECPPGGFYVTIAQINQTHQCWSFGEAVAWFRGIAQSNPRLMLPTDDPTIGNFIDQQNALRVAGMAGAENFIIGKGGPTFLETKKASLLKPLVAVGDKFRQLAAGAILIEDWQAEGFPVVDPGEADSRAAICATCPQNGLGDLSRWFTVFASEKIRHRIEAAKNLDLKTDSDAKIGICEACLCPLKLKVHVPLPLIKKHLTQKSLEALDHRCWILLPPADE